MFEPPSDNHGLGSMLEVIALQIMHCVYECRWLAFSGRGRRISENDLSDERRSRYASQPVMMLDHSLIRFAMLFHVSLPQKMFVYITFSFGRSKILIQLAIMSRKLKSKII